MIKFRSKLLFAILSLIAVSIIGIGLLLVQLFGSYDREEFISSEQKQAKKIASFIEKQGGIQSVTSGQPVMRGLGLLDDGLTILTAEGEVVYQANKPDKVTEANHRRYLSMVVKGNQEDFIEMDGGFPIFYFGKKIMAEDGKAAGYAVITAERKDIRQLNGTSWLILTGALVFCMFLLSLIIIKLSNRFTMPIEAATNTAIELAKGNYRARTYENPTDEMKMLSTSINILARNLQEMETSREMQQDRLSTLIENIGSGVLLIDSKGYITLMNKTYKHLFNVSPSVFLYRLYYEALQYEEVILMIEEIFMTEKSVKKQMMLSLKIERKHFEVYGAPIIGVNDEWKGIVLVFHDISELKKLEQMRQDFVANVSHELRTPITSIKGFSETLLDGDLKDQQTLRAFLTIILNESDRLQMLIQELLELSKIEKSEFALAMSKIDLASLVRDTGEMFKRKAEKKQISFTVENKGPVIIEADSSRLKQVLINLISNAFNYTQEGGNVWVRIKEDDNYAYLEVEDTGIGIDEKEIPRIFERFYRVDRARSRNSGGTGLGLAIVKHLVEAHKGLLEVNSIPGEGTTFIVRLRKNRRKYK
ncbi:two-component system histidine kinase PnpS [Bacillus sp. 1P06AnD]|uniref:two-component system histidine kinase PnpS n=1 Tax=Bacillus sp. 1P06AnD TaxID=3132208 RepID=UPI0039A059ED